MPLRDAGCVVYSSPAGFSNTKACFWFTQRVAPLPVPVAGRLTEEVWGAHFFVHGQSYSEKHVSQVDTALKRVYLDPSIRTIRLVAPILAKNELLKCQV